MKAIPSRKEKTGIAENKIHIRKKGELKRRKLMNV